MARGRRPALRPRVHSASVNPYPGLAKHFEKLGFPTLVLVLHWPGLMMAPSLLLLNSTAALVVAEAVTRVQMFAVAGLVIALWRRLDGSYAAERARAARGRDGTAVA